MLKMLKTWFKKTDPNNLNGERDKANSVIDDLLKKYNKGKVQMKIEGSSVTVYEGGKCLGAYANSSGGGSYKHAEWVNINNGVVTGTGGSGALIAVVGGYTANSNECSCLYNADITVGGGSGGGSIDD